MTKLKIASDTTLFRSHDIANILVFLFVIGLPYAGAGLFPASYQAGKLLHLMGLVWFFGGLIFAAFCASRFVWSQPNLDHDRVAWSFRAILVLELFCIPSIALMAYGGVAMANQLGGVNSQAWMFHGYLFLLGTPIILMVIPRFYHKRIIKDVELDIAKEQRLALWQDWVFIVLMSALLAAISGSMVWKTPIF